VAYWAYQIQDISAPGAVDSLAVSHYDMLVIEPTRTDWSSDDKNFLAIDDDASTRVLTPEQCKGATIR
jgi:hypothetical protein